MGKRGPKPTPTPILKLRQSWRGKQRGSDPKLDQKRPACPKRFITKQKTEDGEAVRLVAKRTWDRLAKPMYEAGLLIDNQREAFAKGCDSYGWYELANQKCMEDSPISETSNGNAVQNPWWAVRTRAWEQVDKWLAQFGLTPADVSGVRSVEKPTAEDGKGRFFKGA